MLTPSRNIDGRCRKSIGWRKRSKVCAKHSLMRTSAFSNSEKSRRSGRRNSRKGRNRKKGRKKISHVRRAENEPCCGHKEWCSLQRFHAPACRRWSLRRGIFEHPIPGSFSCSRQEHNQNTREGRKADLFANLPRRPSRGPVRRQRCEDAAARAF